MHPIIPKYMYTVHVLYMFCTCTCIVYRVGADYTCVTIIMLMIIKILDYDFTYDYTYMITLMITLYLHDFIMITCIHA